MQKDTPDNGIGNLSSAQTPIDNGGEKFAPQLKLSDPNHPSIYNEDHARTSSPASKNNSDDLFNRIIADWTKYGVIANTVLGAFTLVTLIITLCLFASQNRKIQDGNNLTRESIDSTKAALSLAREQAVDAAKQFSIEQRPIILIGDSAKFGWPLDRNERTRLRIKNSGKGVALNVHSEFCYKVSKGFHARFLIEKSLLTCQESGQWGPIVIGPGEAKDVQFTYQKMPPDPGYDTLYFRFRITYQSPVDTSRKGLVTYGYFPPPHSDGQGKWVGGPFYIRDSVW